MMTFFSKDHDDNDDYDEMMMMIKGVREKPAEEIFQPGDGKFCFNDNFLN